MIHVRHSFGCINYFAWRFRFFAPFLGVWCMFIRFSVSCVHVFFLGNSGEAEVKETAS